MQGCSTQPFNLPQQTDVTVVPVTLWVGRAESAGHPGGGGHWQVTEDLTGLIKPGLLRFIN